MTLTSKKAETAKELLSEVQKEDAKADIRLSPYIMFSSGQTSGWILDRRAETSQLTYRVEDILTVSGETWTRKRREDIGKLASKLACEAALANVVQQDGKSMTLQLDGVKTVDATGGLIVDTLEELVASFDYLDDLVFVVSKEELERLSWLSKIHKGDPRFCFRDGILTHFFGMEIIPVYTYKQEPILTVKHGIRSCFVMQKGALEIRTNWKLDDDDKNLVAQVEAVRVDGEKVIRVWTTA
jgi:hypothetical protein